MDRETSVIRVDKEASTTRADKDLEDSKAVKQVLIKVARLLDYQDKDFRQEAEDREAEK